MTTSCPQQIQRLSGGNLVAASAGDDRVFEFDLSGNVLRSIGVANARGVFELGNGRWLVTHSSAVVSIDPDTGDRDIVFAGDKGRFIELVPDPGTSMLLVIPGIICRSRRR